MSKQAYFGILGRQVVRNHHESQRDNRPNQVDGRGVLKLSVPETCLQNISVQNLGQLHVRRLLQQQELIHVRPQDSAHPHDEHDADGGGDAGDGHMPGGLPAVRAVDGGRLVEPLIHSGDGGQIYDGAPAYVLPDVRQDDQRVERPFLAQHEDGIQPHGLADVIVDAAVGGEERRQQCHHHGPGYEVGQIAHGLNHTLELLRPHLIEQQGQYDRRRETDDNLHDADDHCIPRRRPELRGREERFEMLEPRPFAAVDT